MGIVAQKWRPLTYEINLMLVGWFVTRESNASGGWPIVATPNEESKRLAVGQSA